MQRDGIKRLFCILLLCAPALAQTHTEVTLEDSQAITGAKTIGSLNNIVYVDGVKNLTITAAVAQCAAYTGASGNSCMIVAPPGAACGEPSQMPDNVVLFDYRNCAQSQGIRFNLSAAVTGNVRSKWFIQDNYNASTIGLSPNKSAVSAYINSYVDQPEVTNGTVAAFNGTMNVNSQLANMTSGTIAGVEGSAQNGSTNASALNIVDMRGVIGNTFIGGNSTATRMVGVYGQQCTKAGTGAVTNCFGGYFELPTIASGINRAAHFQGETSFGGVETAPRIIVDGGQNGTISEAGLIASGSAATLAGTGACATRSNQLGGAYAGQIKCTGTTGASTLTITPGLTAPNGYTCWANDITHTLAGSQSTASTTAPVMTFSSVTANDVLTFGCIEY